MNHKMIQIKCILIDLVIDYTHDKLQENRHTEIKL